MRATARNEGEQSPRKVLAVLALDVAVPTAGYYVLRGFGVGVVPALAATSVAAALRVVWSVCRQRRADTIAVFVLVAALISIPASLIVGSPRVMLAKEEIGIPPLGLWLVLRGLRGNPVEQWFQPWLVRTREQGAAWSTLLQRPGPLRRALASATAVWGAAFLLCSATRLAVIIWLPVDTAILVSQLALPTTFLLASLTCGPFANAAGRALAAEVDDPGHRVAPVSDTLARRGARALRATVSAVAPDGQNR